MGSGKSHMAEVTGRRCIPQSERRESGVVSGIRIKARRGVIVDHFKGLKFGPNGERKEGPSIN